MSWLHIVEKVGMGALHAARFIPGVPGVVATTVGAVVDAELSGKPGPEKKADAVASASATIPEVPGKMEIIGELLEAVVAFLNALAKLFPPEPKA